MNSDSAANWHADHSRFSRLLDVLDDQIQTLSRGGNSQINLLLSILEYLRDYPDQYHHPREDLIFERLQALRPGIRPVIDQLIQDHRTIARLGAELHQILQAAVDGSVIPREQIKAAAEAYIAQYRKHLETEERVLIPEAVNSLQAGDWNVVAHAIPPRIDRLFGKDFDAKYRELRAQIE